MQMRWVCTEVTLGLKETSRSGEKDLWHDQSAIKTLYSKLQVCECGLNHPTILSYRGTSKR
jgi:hypothetical protein